MVFLQFKVNREWKMKDDLIERLKSLEETLKEKTSAPKTMADAMPQIIILLFTGILVVLKALGMISISWWWVTLLLWLPFAIVLGFLALCVVGGLIVLTVGLIVGTCEFVAGRMKDKGDKR
jgi:fatty acid desaturase